MTREDERVCDMAEAVINAVMEQCTDTDGMVDMSQDEVLGGLVNAFAWFAALNPKMGDAATRKALLDGTARNLSALIEAARADHKENGVDDLMAGGWVH